MKFVECIDVLELLRINGGTLKDVTCYGYIREELPRPNNIFSTVELEAGGKFRRMSVFAMNLESYREQLAEMGVYQTVLYVRGDILVFVPSAYSYPDWYKVSGTMRFGTKTVTNYVTMLRYMKDPKGRWFISTTLPQDVEIYESLTDSIREAITGVGKIPAELENLPAMQATADTNQFLNNFDADFHIASGSNYMPEAPCTVEESRPDFKTYCNEAEVFERLLAKAEEQFSLFVDSIKKKYEMYEETDYVTRLLTALRSNLKRRSGENAMTGQSLIKKYLSKYGKLAQGKSGGMKVTDVIINNFDAVCDYVLYGSLPPFDKKAKKLCEEAFNDSETVYSGILSALLGIDFSRALCRLSENNMSFAKVVNENPYILFMMGLISFSDAEYLGVLFNKHDDPNISRFRNICILHEYIMHSNSNSTAYRVDKLNDLGIDERYFAVYATSNVSLFFTGYTVRGYDTTHWRQVNRKRRYVLSTQQTSVALQDYIRFGLGVEHNGILTSSNFLRKELYIYNTLMNNTEDIDYDSEDIDEKINEYEEIVGFTLEKEQRQAVHLCVKSAGCIAGSAGSGKTTTVGCIVYVLSKIDSNLQVQFAAPTGKAAKVLQGVVKQPVYTLNSLCRVGFEEDDIFTVETEQSNESRTLYFFDEMGMVSLDLFYRAMRKLHGSRFLFIGDIHQLESINKGMVFKNLLRFLPCVYLKVSKRSAENSGITYNSDVVNNYSYRNRYKELKNTQDFRIIPCNDGNIKDAVISICEHYLHGGSNAYGVPDMNVTPDDIQVITPVTKLSYRWGSKYLNKYLQEVFNRPKKPEDICSIRGTRFIIGDRVIHTTENTYSMQWYSSYKGGNFQKVYGSGIANGQVGKLVAIYPVSMCQFYDEVDEKPVDFRYPDSLRNDSTFDAVNGYFIVVEYVDSMTDDTFYILYRSSKKDGVSIEGYDTGLLDIFYAGSTHKMQGSQSKIAICCVGTMNFGTFLTRNMLYTLITRGSDLVILIGSMSQIEKMRASISGKDVLTVQELFVK